MSGGVKEQCKEVPLKKKVGMNLESPVPEEKFCMNLLKYQNIPKMVCQNVGTSLDKNDMIGQEKSDSLQDCAQW